MTIEAGKVRRFRYDGDVYFYRADNPDEDEDIEYGTHFVMESDYEALEKRARELEADAERYRKLIEYDYPLCFLGQTYNSPDEFSAAIDAAIAAEGEKNG